MNYITFDEFQQKGFDRGVTVTEDTLDMYWMHIYTKEQRREIRFWSIGIPEDLDPVLVEQQVTNWLDSRIAAASR